MDRYAVIVSKYPSEEKPNEFGFVHSRVRAYMRSNIEVDVYVISRTLSKEYQYEGVSVFCGDKEYIKAALEEKKYTALLIHCLDKTKIDIIGDHKCYIWVHGFEVLSWKRRLFNLNPRLPLYIMENTKQRKCFREYAKSHPQSTFVFVSNWIYEVACKDIGYKIENYEIIHNYIDDTIFKFSQKDPEARKKFLSIRSFANKKYANDISVKIIKELSKKPYFDELQFTFYGNGRYFDALTKKIQKFKNVEINKCFIPHSTIAELQKEYGVFLCPTRQDTQGVSMGEAMSSGLVVLTSHNTAIPEFVGEGEGLLCNNSQISSFVEAYEKIYNDPNLFMEICEKASKRVQEQCSYENTILKEIRMINK